MSMRMMQEGELAENAGERKWISRTRSLNRQEAMRVEVGLNWKKGTLYRLTGKKTIYVVKNGWVDEHCGKGLHKESYDRLYMSLMKQEVKFSTKNENNGRHGRGFRTEEKI